MMLLSGENTNSQTWLNKKTSTKKWSRKWSTILRLSAPRCWRIIHPRILRRRKISGWSRRLGSTELIGKWPWRVLRILTWVKLLLDPHSQSNQSKYPPTTLTWPHGSSFYFSQDLSCIFSAFARLWNLNWWKHVIKMIRSVRAIRIDSFEKKYSHQYTQWT